MSNEQAVNSADSEPTASDETVVAQEDNLETLLSEFDTGTEEPEVKVSEPEKTTGLSVEDKSLLEDFRAHRDSEALNKEITTIKGHLPEDVQISDKLFKQIVVGMADENRAFANAYVNRRSNPDGWDKVQKAIAGEIGKEFSARPDQSATDSHEAVVAAVRSASTTIPQEDKPLTPEDLNKLSDAEFQKLEISMK